MQQAVQAAAVQRLAGRAAAAAGWAGASVGVVVEAGQGAEAGRRCPIGLERPVLSASGDPAHNPQCSSLVNHD